MLKFSRLAGIMAAMVLALMWAAPASAQATRTWVSGVGDDANPCSRTAPCKTFAGAISKTAAGGEIDCLDPGGFGTITITKSITLDCGGGPGGQVGSILASGTNGITINAASVMVKIRNMTINGIQGSGSAGLSGIKFVQGSTLIVEHVGIFGFGGSTGNNAGIDFEPQTAGGKLSVVDSEVQFGLGDGVLIKPTSTGTAYAALTRVSAMGNTGAGIRVDSTNVTSGTFSENVTIDNCFLSSNGAGLNVTTPVGGVGSVAQITNSVVTNNNNFGILANAGSTVRFGGDTVTGNVTGVAGAGSLKSFGDNYFAGNTNDGTPTAPNLTKL